MTETLRAGGARRDATVLTVGTMASGIAAYGFVAIGTRSVGAEAFAPVSVLWSLWAVSAAAITFPVQHWVIRTVEASRDESGIWAAAPALWRTVAMASLLVFAVTWVLGERLFTTPGWAFPLMAACLPAGSVVMGFNRGLLAARDRFRATAVAILGENLLRVVLALGLAAAVTAEGLGWILVAGFAVGLLYPRTLFGRSTGAHAPPSRSLLGGLAGANAAAQVALTSGPIVLSLVGGTEAGVTALFAMLAVLRAPHTVAVGMTARVTGPLTRLATTGQVARLRRIEYRLVAATVVLAALAALLAPAVVPQVTSIVFDVGEDVPAAATALLTAGTVVALAGLVEMLVLVARDRTRRLVGAWVGAIVAGGATLLVPATPITRVAAAFLVAEAVALALMVAGTPRTERSPA